MPSLLLGLVCLGVFSNALATAWLAAEIRAARCGHVAPRLLKLIGPLDRMETKHMGGEPLRDYA